MGQVLVLTESDVRRVLGIKEANDLVEECFRAIGCGDALNLVTTGVTFDNPPGRCAIKSGYLRERRSLGIKVVRVHPHNANRDGLPVMNCQILAVDGETGVIQAIMDGTYITRVRTGSAGAVGARFLARPEARRIAVIGAGVQGRAQLEALAADRLVGPVSVWSRTAERRERYAQEMSSCLGMEVRPTASVKEACLDAEIIITATWSHEPLVTADWVRPGTYIAAVGADAPGMQELDPTLLMRSKVVVDDLEQCIRMGEINVPVKEGQYSIEAIHGTIGEVVAGIKPGRTDGEEITIFDSTGLGVQDAIAADHVFRLARSMRIGTWVSI